MSDSGRSSIKEKGENPVVDQWLRTVEEKDIESHIAQVGQRIDLGGGAIIEVLNPQRPPLTDTYSDVDNNGVVLHIVMGEVSFLLTADLMWEGELELTAHRTNLNSTVLKVAHHGSDTSTTPQFLAVVDPKLAVISVGED
jgi:competence protein ComEC